MVIATDLNGLLERTLPALGYELVDCERSKYGQVRVFIDKPGGITVDDCASVSHHLTRLFAVEGVEFDRLEISSPGLDRPLKRLSDFTRFTGHKVKVKLFAAEQGRKKFIGRIAAVTGDQVQFVIEDEGKEALEMTLSLTVIERARLVPDI